MAGISYAIYVLFVIVVSLLFQSLRRQRPYRPARSTASWSGGSLESRLPYSGVSRAMARQHSVTVTIGTYVLAVVLFRFRRLPMK